MNTKKKRKGRKRETRRRKPMGVQKARVGVKTRMSKRKYDYKIAIPTYKRVDLFEKKTYGKVIKPGKLEDRVILFIQNDEDEELYRKRFPRLKQVRSPPGYHPTLNFISKYFKKDQRYVKMDDDVAGLFKVDEGFVERGGGLKKIKNAGKIFNECFRWMDKRGSNLGGFYPSTSWFRGPKVSTDLRFIMGACYCVRNQKIFLPEANSKSDFELTIKYFQHDRTVVRMNRIGIRTSYASGEGGVDRTKSSENRDNERLAKKYPSFVKRSIKHKNGTSSLVLVKNPVL